MNDDRLLREVRSWLVEADPEPPDARASVRQAMASTRRVRRRGRWWPLTILGRTASRATTDQSTKYQPSPIPATTGDHPTVTGRTQFMLSPVKAITAAALVFAIGGVMLIAQPFDQHASVPGATADEVGLVTEEVEPGVERIIRDDAGHDLDEGHPTNRYDMDNVLVAPDGTVWLSSSYLGSDNDVNAYGPLVWALGQPETPQFSVAVFCETDGIGVTCFDPATETETTYLADTTINQLALAPDGTYWAVGSHGVENGGLYHLTFEQ
jgi:hypothetical protein